MYEAFYLAVVIQRVSNAHPPQVSTGVLIHFSLFDGGEDLLGASGDL